MAFIRFTKVIIEQTWTSFFEHQKSTQTCSSYSNPTQAPYFWLWVIELQTSNIVWFITSNMKYQIPESKNRKHQFISQWRHIFMLFTAKQSVEKSDYNRYTTLPKKIYCLFSLLSKAMLVFFQVSFVKRNFNVADKKRCLWKRT